VRSGVTIRTLTAQLAMRLTVIAAMLATVGVWSYSATHWEQSTGGAGAPSTATAQR
jgi:hypothetical protein